MKTLGKLKLNQLDKDSLTVKEMKLFRGGDMIGGTPIPDNCSCGCFTTQRNLPSTNENYNANYEIGGNSPTGTCVCGCEGSINNNCDLGFSHMEGSF